MTTISSLLVVTQVWLVQFAQVVPDLDHKLDMSKLGRNNCNYCRAGAPRASSSVLIGQKAIEHPKFSVS